MIIERKDNRMVNVASLGYGECFETDGGGMYIVTNEHSEQMLETTCVELETGSIISLSDNLKVFHKKAKVVVEA